MTIHQLYDGGPANSTIKRTQWPAYPFSASDPAFAAIDVSQHFGSQFALLRRVLDFKNDYALRNYFTNNAVAAADVLNLILLPPTTLLVGLYLEVENIEDNGTAMTITAGTAAGLKFGYNGTTSVAVDCTALSANFSPVGGAWVNGTAGGTVSLATTQYIGTQPDMVQVTLASLATASLAGFGNLRLNLEAVVLDLGEHKATNF